MPYPSSLPTLVDIDDWLDEDLPATVARLAAAVPDRVGIGGLPASYPSVVGDDALGAPADSRVLARVAQDDDYLHELVGVVQISIAAGLNSHLTEQSESMNFPAKRF